MNIILGITGSISAYKTPWLVRDLIRAGHTVRVIMTPSARQFVAPLALEAVSQSAVIIDPYDPSIQEGGSWHVHLAQWADLILIAPCSATTLARLAMGLCDTALMTVVASRPPGTPLIISPAMDSDMWLQPAVQRNIEQVRNDGVEIIDPATGELASGLVGIGRLPELDAIVGVVGA
ncbi:MAG: phosphopantothenoylcysteine decarboxylase, partial [Candidatus Kapabacteria bacterium]|nr:phosphopantothenoylcysteine decarboxylase [Candidatus Kapabacteria bacterium]